VSFLKQTSIWFNFHQLDVQNVKKMKKIASSLLGGAMILAGILVVLALVSSMVTGLGFTTSVAMIATLFGEEFGPAGLPVAYILSSTFCWVLS
jgi:hypothetical protein